MMKLKYLFIIFSFFFVCCSSGEPVFAQPKSSTSILGKSILEHPRLLFSTEEEIEIKELSKSDPLLSDLLMILKTQADELLYTPTLDHPNDLGKSREHVYRIITLATAYRLFDEDIYAKRAETLLINICRYPSWNPTHYLDVAETTTAVAIGYDWLYDYLSDDSKELIKDAIISKALNLSIPVYESSDNTESWAKRDTNWNVVCNTGMTLGALAVAENNPVFAEKIIKYASHYVPNCLNHYAPDGVCYEGPGYWNYTNVYLSLLLKSLNDNLGHDFGISNLPGVSKTASYYVQSLSPTGKEFNFANSGGIESSASPLFFYFGKTFNQPEVISYYKKKLTDIAEKKMSIPKWHFFLSVAWYQKTTSSPQAYFPPLQVFRNDLNPILVFNGDRNKEGSVYMTAKGGDPDAAHQQLDAGSFIIESEGVRWTDDLGSDRYDLPGFWDYKPTGQRWEYFRNNNFSHNTLSLDNKLQFSQGKGVLAGYNTESVNPYGIIDLTTIYKDQAESVKRGFKFLDDRVMLIQDDIKPLSGSKTVCWSIITQADIQTTGNQAILSKDGKSFIFKVISPAEAKLTIEVAKTYTSAEKPLSGYKLLKITINSKDLNDSSILILAGNNVELIEQLSMNEYGKLDYWK